METWNLTSLAQLLASDPDPLGDVDVSSLPDGDALRVTLKEKGDLDIFVTVSGGRDILASVILAPCDDIPDRESFERMALKTHKLIPLSSFGITVIDGKEWYELFGSLSALSRKEAVVEEIAVLAGNAVDAAEMIEEWKNGEIAR